LGKSGTDGVLFFNVTAAYQLMNHVEGFAGVLPGFDSAAAV